jgi:predicted enzyme related to lactoylglutathione lyase
MARISPYLQTASVAGSVAIFRDILGLGIFYEEGERCVVFDDDLHEQLIVLTHEINPAAPVPSLRFEVENVDLVHQRVVAQGLNVVLPLTNEPWARRFFFEDHDGHIHNVLQPTGASLRSR